MARTDGLPDQGHNQIPVSCIVRGEAVPLDGSERVEQLRHGEQMNSYFVSIKLPESLNHAKNAVVSSLSKVPCCYGGCV